VFTGIGQPIYVDRIVYKDREVQKEVLQEVHVEVEVEKISYVNQLVEKEGAAPRPPPLGPSAGSFAG